ncbi:long-chain-fatty-acid--CoA ligase [Falsigemmobacter faecalis]|uniref:3-methylmercaptopropionyl-CoA ligase n=2 Tax=Falsigemmobacter faecalis TaxID=2488730 RepID=A0A3P3DUT6_9RHOB|nr:long-chain-fatty-acid--CoA ligase [Falsigemmobacter faecalis]
MCGLMMHRELSIPAILDYAAEVTPGLRITSARVEGDLHSYTIREARVRIRRLASALQAQGFGPGDRIATLAWNGYRHFELYYAIAGIGAVCHTINPRLFPEQISWIMNHAKDQALFFDTTFNDLVASLHPQMPAGIKLYSLSDTPVMPGATAFETLIAGAEELSAWTEVPEATAVAMCYTSGTTGDPKAALYSHRSTILHAMSTALAAPDSFGQGRRVMPVVPLFHVNAWGLPYTAPLTGTDIVFPGPKLDGASVFSLMEETGVTASWGVPTVWAGLLEEMRKAGRKPAGLEVLYIGGSALAPAMIGSFDAFNVRALHAWGMTEMSPIGTITRPTPSQDPAERIAEATPQGKRTFGVEIRIVDEEGQILPHDDQATGELLVRGHGVISAYYDAPAASAKAFDAEGWFRTGDVARISPEGQLTIVDRTKDLIKSGGEWISSIDLENAAIACAGVAMAAAVAVPHPRWDERPLLAVIRAPGSEVTPEAILEVMAARMPKWQLPDDVVFVESIPLTATGKISKKDLRVQLKDYYQS